MSGYDNVRNLWFKKLRLKKYQRIGQCAFNCLSELYPELGRKVLGTKHDPFYKDERIHDFWEWLYQQSEKE
jgi:hypothetical protein